MSGCYNRSMFNAHDPHIPSRHDLRKVKIWNILREDEEVEVGVECLVWGSEAWWRGRTTKLRLKFLDQDLILVGVVGTPLKDLDGVAGNRCRILALGWHLEEIHMA
ncbi:hypothetical protein Tco_0584345 [Tanacetum coccineum]